jgi:hypothetical protein
MRRHCHPADESLACENGVAVHTPAPKFRWSEDYYYYHHSFSGWPASLARALWAQQSAREIFPQFLNPQRHRSPPQAATTEDLPLRPNATVIPASEMMVDRSTLVIIITNPLGYDLSYRCSFGLPPITNNQP